MEDKAHIFQILKDRPGEGEIREGEKGRGGEDKYVIFTLLKP